MGHLLYIYYVSRSTFPKDFPEPYTFFLMTKLDTKSQREEKRIDVV
jgi:hypothetical protein